MYHVGFSFTEAWNIPIAWRRWFIERLNRENEKQATTDDKSTDDGGYAKFVQSALGRSKSFK